jgi:pyruvate/2-oxoglutarate dehydrogenase complex dihydrolipoamide acyltransferase (E2) component
MQRDAGKSSVALPPRDSKGSTYSFSFAAQRESLAYAPGSLEPLSVQLGEVKSICAVLFQAKVNSLDSLRRERVSDDDLRGPQTDYLPEKSVTNELAVMSPYEVSFRCFSSELAAVLGGFAVSPCGLLVKTINGESAPAAAPASEPIYTAAPAASAAPAPRPYVPPAAPAPRAAEAAPDDFAARYGLGGRGGAPAPAAPPARLYTRPGASASPAASRGGLPSALDEKQLKVTLMLYVVKLVPAK